MWAVSPAFLSALTQSHTLATTCTVTTPGGSSASLTLSRDLPNTVSATAGQLIRRTAQLGVVGTSSIWSLLAVPGAVVSVSHGIDFGGGQKELVPMIKGELANAATDLGDGLIGLMLADYGKRVQDSPFLTAQSPATSAGRVATASAAVTGGAPTTVTNTASDTASIGTQGTWTSRADMIDRLLTDAGAEGFFRPDGSYLIRDLPQVTDQPVWAFTSGPGGTVEKLTRNRPNDRIFNTVVVRPGAGDGAQTWTQVIAQITDTANPRHPNYIGVRPYFWDSPTIMSTAEAQSVAGKILAKVQGSLESLALGAVSNPALECGDVIRATNPLDAGVGIVQHLIDSLTVDLITGSMQAATRSGQEAFA